MRVYKRGDRFPPEFDSFFASNASRSKYWLVGPDGEPVGKPFARRFEIHLLHVATGEEYEIDSRPVGRPPSGKTPQEIRADHDRKRADDAGRKAKKAQYARDRRARQKQSKQAED